MPWNLSRVSNCIISYLICQISILCLHSIHVVLFSMLHRFFLFTSRKRALFLSMRVFPFWIREVTKWEGRKTTAIRGKYVGLPKSSGCALQRRARCHAYGTNSILVYLTWWPPLKLPSNSYIPCPLKAHVEIWVNGVWRPYINRRKQFFCSRVELPDLPTPTERNPELCSKCNSYFGSLCSQY